MTLRNDKVQVKELDVSIKTFCRKWEEEALPKLFLYLNNLENTKTNAILPT